MVEAVGLTVFALIAVLGTLQLPALWRHPSSGDRRLRISVLQRPKSQAPQRRWWASTWLEGVRRCDNRLMHVLLAVCKSRCMPDSVLWRGLPRGGIRTLDLLIAVPLVFSAAQRRNPRRRSE